MVLKTIALLIFAFDKIIVNPQVRTPFDIVFGEKRLQQLPQEPKGNFIFISKMQN